MRLGTVIPFGAWERLTRYSLDFLEILAPHVPPQEELPPLPNLPVIWQCPPQLPLHHPDPNIRQAVLKSWLEHLEAAQRYSAQMMVVQFHRPAELANKTAFIEQTIALLNPLTQHGVQVVLRNSPDNREQLQLLREIMRGVAGLGLALDLAYTEHQVIKNLMPEYLWDSDLSGRLAHVYVSDTNGKDAELRLPLGSVGKPHWAKLVRQLKERYNASVTLDIGRASWPYLELSRQHWLAWWED